MTDLLFKIQKYVNEEDVLAAKRLTGKWKNDEEIDLQNKKKDPKFNPSASWASMTSLEMLKAKALKLKAKRKNFLEVLQISQR